MHGCRRAPCCVGQTLGPSTQSRSLPREMPVSWGRSHPGAGFRPAGPRGCRLGDPALVCHLPSCYPGYFAAFWNLLQRVAAGCMGKQGKFSKSEQAVPAGHAGGTQGVGRQLPARGRAGNFPLSLKRWQGIRTLCPQWAGDIQRRFGLGGVSTSGRASVLPGWYHELNWHPRRDITSYDHAA